MSLSINFRSVRTGNGSVIKSVILLNEEGVVRMRRLIMASRRKGKQCSAIKLMVQIESGSKTQELYYRCLCLLI